MRSTMGDSAREVMEVTCASCDTKFRLRLTKGRLPRQAVECPSCGATIPVAEEQPKAAILKRSGDQKVQKQDQTTEIRKTPEAPTGGTLLGLPIDGVFEFPSSPGAFDREPTAVKNPSSPLPLGDLGEISDSEFKNTTRQPWDNERTAQASSLQAMASSEVDNSRETPFESLSSTSSSAQAEKPKPKLNELLKRVREKRGTVPEPRFSFDSVAELLEETAQSLSEASSSPQQPPISQSLEAEQSVSPPTRPPAAPKTTRPNSDNRKTAPAMDPAFRERAQAGMASERQGSGYIRLPTSELLEVIGEGDFKLRVGKLIYEPVSEESLVKLIKGGVLMGAEFIADADGEWMPVNDHPAIKRLRKKMADEAHALLQGISTSREAIDQEDADEPISEDTPSRETPPTEEISDDLLIAQRTPPPLPPEVSEVSEVPDAPEVSGATNDPIGAEVVHGLPPESAEIDQPAALTAGKSTQLTAETEDTEDSRPAKKSRVLPLLGFGLAAVAGLSLAGSYYYSITQGDQAATVAGKEVEPKPKTVIEPDPAPEPKPDPVVEKAPEPVSPQVLYEANPSAESALKALASFQNQPIEAALFAFIAAQAHNSPELHERQRELQLSALSTPFAPTIEEAEAIRVEGAQALQLTWKGAPAHLYLENGNQDADRKVRASSVLCSLADCGFGVPLVLNVQLSREALQGAPEIPGTVWKTVDDVETVEGVLVVNPSLGADFRIVAMQSLWRNWMRSDDEFLDSPLADQLDALKRELGDDTANAMLAEAKDMSVRDFLKGVSAALTFDFLTNNSDRFDGKMENFSIRDKRFYSRNHVTTFQPRASTRVRGRFSWAARLDQGSVTSLLALEESQSELLFPNTRSAERGPLNIFWSQHKTLKDRSGRASWL